MEARAAAPCFATPAHIADMSAVEVTIEEWLEVWGGVVGRARKMDDLPMWLQYYPKTLFDTINRSGSGVITKQELNLFYTAFLGTNKQQL